MTGWHSFQLKCYFSNRFILFIEARHIKKKQKKTSILEHMSRRYDTNNATSNYQITYDFLKLIYLSY